MHPRQSLLDYLTHENPTLSNQRCASGRNTTSNKTLWKQPRYIEAWKDFNYDSLKAMYGGALNAVLQHQSPPEGHPDIPQFPFCDIHDENSLESLLVMWNQVVIVRGLTTAQEEFNRERINDPIFMVKGGQSGKRSSFRPDWAGIRQSTCFHRKATNVLPGDTKLSKKWASGKIELGPIEGDYQLTDWLRPLTQIYTYCCKGNARYGYIITDKELVVLRVRPGSQIDTQRAVSSHGSVKAPTASPADRAGMSGTLEFKAIPWTEEQTRSSTISNGLTVNLALWWLHMLAAEDSKIEDTYSPLLEAARSARTAVDVFNDNRERTPAATTQCSCGLPLPQADPITPPPSGRSNKRTKGNGPNRVEKRKLRARTRK